MFFEKERQKKQPGAQTAFMDQILKVELDSATKKDVIEIFDLFNLVKNRMDALTVKKPDVAQKIGLIWRVAYKDCVLANNYVHMDAEGIISMIAHLRKNYPAEFHLFMVMDIFKGMAGKEPGS